MEEAIEELADWLVTQLGDICETAHANGDARLGNHALLTLARLGGFVRTAPLPIVLLYAISWVVRVQANESAARGPGETRLWRCGAKRKRDGSTCQAKPFANGRCKFHGGMSTGPRTAEGRVRSLSNLRQNRGPARPYQTP